MSKPPKYPLRLLRWFCKPDRIEEIEGDLVELYEIREKSSPGKAGRRFTLDVLLSFRPQNIRKPKIAKIMISAFQNYLKIYLRRLRIEPVHYIANILGLTLGMTILGLTMLYVFDELSIDQFHAQKDNIYRVIIEKTSPEGVRQTASGMNPMAKALKQDFPEIESASTFSYFGSSTFSYNERSIAERHYVIVDPDFFNIWDVKLKQGSLSQVFAGPVGLVLTEGFAKRLFGDVDPIGKMVETRLGNNPVIAIVEDLPSNSSIQPELFFVSHFDRWSEDFQQFYSDWNTDFMGTWVKFSEGSDPGSLELQKEEFLKKYLEPEEADRTDFYFQSIKDMHFESGHLSEGAGEPLLSIPYSSRKFVYLIFLIGACVIVIACLNFINLSSVQALKRTKEAGVRKVHGASSSALKIQQFVETFITLILSLVLSIIAMILFIEPINEVTQKNLTVPDFFQMELVGLFTCIFVLTWILSSYIPALYFARYSHISLAGNNKTMFTGNRIRKLFVVLQFFVTLILVVFVFVMKRQLSYIENKDLGFEKGRIITLDINSSASRQSQKEIVSDLKSFSAIENAAAVSRVPGEWKDIPVSQLAKSPDEPKVDANHYAFDQNAIKTLGIKLKKGRNFSGNTDYDTLKVILNETAVDELALDEAIGKSIRITQGEITHRMTVIGVVEDFHFQSLHEKIKPLYITSWNNPIRSIDYYLMKYKGNPKEVLEHAEKVNNRYDPATPPEFHFLDRQWERYYEAEQTRATVFNFSAIFSILISIIGLFGLIDYTVERRTKEIGIRKVLGASAGSIFNLILKDYFVLFAIATLFATPLSIWLSWRWLENFTYRVDVSPALFIVAVGGVLIVALTTISLRIFKISRSDPAQSIQQE